MKAFLLTFFLISNLCLSTMGQSADSGQDNVSQSFYLPPLGDLIDSAVVNSKRIASLNASRQRFLREAKTIKRDIWRGFRLIGGYNYGNNTNFTVSDGSAVGTNSFDSNINFTTQMIGGYINLSIYDLINRGNNVKTFKLQAREVQYMQLYEEEQVREVVTRKYFDLKLAKSLLGIHVENLENAKTSSMMAERMFLSGEISLDQYTGIKEQELKAKADYETAKLEFEYACLSLENIVGVKLNRF